MGGATQSRDDIMLLILLIGIVVAGVCLRVVCSALNAQGMRLQSGWEPMSGLETTDRLRSPTAAVAAVASGCLHLGWAHALRCQCMCLMGGTVGNWEGVVCGCATCTVHGWVGRGCRSSACSFFLDCDWLPVPRALEVAAPRLSIVIVDSGPPTKYSRICF